MYIDLEIKNRRNKILILILIIIIIIISVFVQHHKVVISEVLYRVEPQISPDKSRTKFLTTGAYDNNNRRERDFILIPAHFYHATTLQLRAFARHSAS